MKFSRFLFFATLLFVLASCNKDDDANPSSTDLAGDWKVTEIIYGGTSTTEVSGTSTTADFTGVGVNMNLNISFAENPNDYTTNGDYGIDLTTEVMGQSFDFSWTNVGFIDAGTWEKNGDQLTITNGNGETSSATITTLNSTTLIIDWAYVNVETQQGATVTYNVMGTYTFERQ